MADNLPLSARARKRAELAATDWQRKPGPRRDHLQSSFIESFKSSGTILAACVRLGIDRKTVYTWFDDEKFKEMWAEAQEAVTELVETAAMARGVNGVERYVINGGRPVVDPAHQCQLIPEKDQNGKPTGKMIGNCPAHWLKYREYSDHMLEKLLEARAPHKYARRFATEVKVDVKIVAAITSDIMGIIRRNTPDACPHCKNLLGITQAIAQEMEKLSHQFEART